MEKPLVENRSPILADSYPMGGLDRKIRKYYTAFTFDGTFTAHKEGERGGRVIKMLSRVIKLISLSFHISILAFHRAVCRIYGLINLYFMIR